MKGFGAQQLLSGKRRTALGRLREKTQLRDAAAMFGCAFFLSGAKVMGQSLPLAVCLVAALPFGTACGCACIGGVGGYVVLCGGLDSGDLIGASILMFAAKLIFRGTTASEKSFFFPLLAAGVTALLSGLYLFGGAFGTAELAFWGARVLLAAAMTVCFRRMTNGDKRARLLFGAGLLMGFAGVKSPIDLGLLLASACLSASREISAAAGAGLALDLTGGYGNGATTVLLLPRLFSELPVCRDKRWRWAVQWVTAASALTFFGQARIENLLALSLGLPMGLLLQKTRWFAANGSREDRAEQRLTAAAEILDTLRAQLPYGVRPAGQTEMESVYDGAAERICRCCPRFHRCWQHRSEQTYRALTESAERILRSGAATVEDFSTAFRENCCHLEGFLTAVNQELEGMLYRRRYMAQLGESRQVLADELDCVADFLRRNTASEFERAAVFAPTVGVSTLAKQGGSANGDTGACFVGANGDYYVVLCDGMGTGKEAERISGDTVRLLHKLLCAGMEAEAALRVVNGAFLLRGNGCFATVDLLQADLCSGRAVLYKWGAAPSYYRSGEGIKKLGEATLPPGVGVGGCPTVYRMELGRGELLIMTTDGVESGKLERSIAAFSGDSPRELAALLISEESAQDDMTAVVLSLNPKKRRTAG